MFFQSLSLSPGYSGESAAPLAGRMQLERGIHSAVTWICLSVRGFVIREFCRTRWCRFAVPGAAARSLAARPHFCGMNAAFPPLHWHRFGLGWPALAPVSPRWSSFFSRLHWSLICQRPVNSSSSAAAPFLIPSARRSSNWVEAPTPICCSFRRLPRASTKAKRFASFLPGLECSA